MYDIVGLMSGGATFFEQTPILECNCFLYNFFICILNKKKLPKKLKNYAPKPLPRLVEADNHRLILGTLAKVTLMRILRIYYCP